MNHNDFDSHVLAGAAATTDGRSGDRDDHGTYVAGTIGGATRCVAKSARLVPAQVPNAVTPGSTTSSGYRSSFSTYGSCADIPAPIRSIRSAWCERHRDEHDQRQVDGVAARSRCRGGASAAPAARVAIVGAPLALRQLDQRPAVSIGWGSSNRLVSR